MEYLDFELTIGPGSGQDYPVALLRSPAGETRSLLRFPFDDIALRDRLKDLQIALLRAGGPQRRRISSPEEMAVQDFGRQLFEALFTGELHLRYDRSLQIAAQRGLGLRVKLYVQTPELAALPWEYLYDQRLGEYLCLSRSTPLVRTLESFLPIQPFTVQPPLRILGMIASPSNLDPLDIAREQSRMKAALQPLEDRHLVRLKWLEGQTWRDLYRAMRSSTWHIFHFSGHGGFDPNLDEGMLALADEQGQAHLLRATEMGRLLADHAPLRLVILNACEGARGGKRDIFSSTAATLARRGIPAVVAMQEEITDPAAIELTRTLYEALAEGKPIDEALTIARTAISLSIHNTLEWGTPVLYLRAQDGRLFNLPIPEPTTSLPLPQPSSTPSPQTPVGSGPASQAYTPPQALPFVPPAQTPVGSGPATPYPPTPQAYTPPQAQPITPPAYTPGLAPAKPAQRKSRVRQIAVATMGTLRALGGAGAGFLLGVGLTGGSSTAPGIVGAILGGACGIGIAILEEKARRGAAPQASNVMRVERVLFAAALGLLIGLTVPSNNATGTKVAAAIIGALLGGVLSIGAILVEKRGRSAQQRGLLIFIRIVRTLIKGGIGLIGSLALGLTIGLIVTATSHPSNFNEVAQLLGDVLLTTLLVGLAGSIIGLVAGAIVEFKSN